MNTYPANTSVSFVVRDSKNAFGVVGAWVQPGPNTCSVRPTPTNAPNIGGVFSSMMSNLTALVEQATAAMGAGQLTTSSTSGSIIPSISTSNKPVDPYPYGFPDFPDEKKKSGPNIGAIVGGVVGGVGGLLLIIILFIFFWRRRKANSRSNYSGHPVDIDPPAGGGPMMTPYPASQAVTQSTAEANKDAEAQRLLAQRATSDSPTTEVSTPELLASKYQRFNSQTSDQMSSSGASSTSPLTGKRGEQLSVSTHSPTSPSPLPPIHQAAPPGLIRGDSYAVETAEDAGPLAAGEVLPPRYNPEWEQRARDSQTGN